MNTNNIKDKITEQMKLLKISEYPFTLVKLTELFRTQISMYHPDKYKEKDANEKSSAIINAYNELKPYADEIKITKIEKEKEMFEFTKACENCDGAGFVMGSARVDENSFDCIKCEDTGVYKVVCSKCERGFFTLKNGKKVKCRTCHGTEVFEMKCNHKVSFERRTFYGMFDETKYVKKRVKCGHCGGSGEVEFNPINPVIPKGAVL